MHPVISHPGRLALYLAAWVPIVAHLTLAIASSAGLGLWTSLAVVAPSSFLYAFVCLSTWYSCRILRLERAGWRLLVTHGVAAVCASGLWALATDAYSGFLIGSPEGSREFASRGIPVLFASGVLLYLLSVALQYVLLAAEASREAQLREKEARILAEQAELRALKAQLNPHFLFNSLNSISALTTADPAGARQMCVLLGEFLRRTLGLGDRGTVPLGEELALARCFLEVEKVRFGARLRLEERIAEDAVGCLVPPLLLQPLLENAVSHGIAQLPEGGLIGLEASREGEYLSIVIENSFDPEARSPRGGGLGLANVRRRLEALHGDRAGLAIRSVGDRYRVEVSLPAEEE